MEILEEYTDAEGNTSAFVKLPADTLFDLAWYFHAERPEECYPQLSEMAKVLKAEYGECISAEVAKAEAAFEHAVTNLL